jgi:WD40 repeat protein
MKTTHPSITKRLLVAISILTLSSISCVAIADHTPTTEPEQIIITEPPAVVTVEVVGQEPNEKPTADVPSPTLAPAETEESSPVLEIAEPINAQVPLSERAITPENADRVELIKLLDLDMARKIVWSADEKWLVISSYHVHFYDAQSLEEVYVIDAVQWPSSVALSPDGTLLAIAQYDGVGLWEVGSWGQLRSLAGSGGTEDVAFSPDGQTLATATGNAVKLWEVGTGKELLTLPAGPTRAVAFSPSGQFIAAAGGVAGQEIKLWDAKSGDELYTLTGHSNWIESLTFSPDGRTLASASVDNTARLWDVSEGRQLRVFTGHENQVTDVAFSPDGRLLASVSWDLTVKLWDVESGAELRSLTGHTEWMQGVAFSPDGATLVSSANDNAVRLWGIAP